MSKKGGTAYGSFAGSTTTPHHVYEAAKEKAKSVLHQASPRLTALEKAFHQALKEGKSCH